MLALAAGSDAKVPLEVARAQKDSERLASEIRSSFPAPTKAPETYPALTAMTILGGAEDVLRILAARVSALSLDSRVQIQAPTSALRTAIDEASGYYARSIAVIEALKDRVEAAVAAQRTAHTDPAQIPILLPEFRVVFPDLLAYAIKSWADLNQAHVVSLGWMDGLTAENVRDRLQSILVAVRALPGARKPLHWGWKVGLGVAAAGAVGGAGYWFWWRRRGRPELEDYDEPMPTGIHTFAVDEESGEVIDAEFVEGHLESGDTLRAVARFIDRAGDS